MEAGFLRRPAIQEMLGAHLSGRTDHGNRLWLLLNAELWHRIHIESMPVDDLQGEVQEVLAAGTGLAGAQEGRAARVSA